MPQGVGTYFPAGVQSPNAWDSADFHTASWSAWAGVIPDMTSAVQAAINAASASGLGGDIILPMGVIRINGVTINAGGINIIGCGWEEYTLPSGVALRGKRGTYIITDNPATPAITIGAGAFNCSIEDCAFLQIQNPDFAGWSPVVCAPSVLVNGGSSCKLRNLLFWGCYTGIQLGDPIAPTPASRTLCRDIYGACFSKLIDVEYATTSLVFDNINHLPSDFLSGLTGTLSYIQQNAIGIWLGPSVKAQLKNLQLNNSLAGLVFGTNNSAPGGLKNAVRPHIAGADFQANLCGVFSNANLDGPGGLRMSDFSITGAQLATTFSASPSVGIVLSLSAYADISDCYIANFEGPAVMLSASGRSTNSDVRFGQNVWIDNWNLNTAAYTITNLLAVLATLGGYGATPPMPSPAIYVGSTKQILYVPYNTRFTAPSFPSSWVAVTPLQSGQKVPVRVPETARLTTWILPIDFSIANFDWFASFASVIQLPPGCSKYCLDSIVIMNATANISAATIGAYTGAGQTGVTLASMQAVTVTQTGSDILNNAQTLTLNANALAIWLDLSVAIHIFVGTAAGSGLADVAITIRPLE